MLCEQPLPVLKNRAWGERRIDAFIAETLELSKLSPSPAADRRILLRRLSFESAGRPVTVRARDFENFDAIGRWRDKDAGQPIDAAGILPGGAKFNGPRELIGVLKNKKAEFSRTLTERLLTYALGRGLEFYDRCTVDDVATDLSKGEYRFSALVEGLNMLERRARKNRQG